jgi:mannose-6-phosphate isomerase-like protein (cupin superfamily)
MKRRFQFACIAAIVSLAPCPLAAQAPGQPTAPRRMTGEYWAAKPATLTPYVAPNRVHWKLPEILASHRGQSDWVQPLVRNQDQDADYISMAPGKKTTPQFYADDRMIFIVQSGAIRVTMEGSLPFTATKGFMVNVPARHIYSLETVGDVPSLRFEARQDGAPPLYPGSEKPAPYPGRVYIKAVGTPGAWADRDTNPVYYDFLSHVTAGDKIASNFVRDDHFVANLVRGKGVPVPPDTDKGHFHVNATEFWYIMEGKLGYKIEGFPYFEADQGDVVIAAKGRWHRATFSPNAPISTRVPINPRPPILHNFEPKEE